MAGLYVHIPFCHSKCAYCDFYSTPRLGDIDVVVGSIVKEYDLRRDEISDQIHTIYFGGGTPSILSGESLQSIVSVLPIKGVRECTIEANPEDINKDKLNLWRRLGFNRISMGIQSLVDTELRLIGRRHTADDARKAVQDMREVGFSNISLDLIYGLPTQTVESWKYSLESVLDMHPEHFSAYMLSYEPGTRLSALLKAGKIEAIDEDVCVEMYNVLIDAAREHGYEHYEISNFSLPGFRALHNSHYWDGTPYIGLGPASHSFDGKVRRVNPSSVTKYVDRISNGQAAYETEKETKIDKLNDKIITSLRTVEGLDIKSVHVRRRLPLIRAAYPYIHSGDLICDGDFIRIPESSWLISDAILRDLLFT